MSRDGNTLVEVAVHPVRDDLDWAYGGRAEKNLVDIAPVLSRTRGIMDEALGW